MDVQRPFHLASPKVYNYDFLWVGVRTLGHGAIARVLEQWARLE
jgi:hypothetical protein